MRNVPEFGSEPPSEPQPETSPLGGDGASEATRIWEEIGRQVTLSPGVVEGSGVESLKETGRWVGVEAAVGVANTIHPGLGLVIHPVCQILEIWKDLEALDNPAAPRSLNVPLADINGIGISLRLPLPGRDGAQEEGPAVIGVIAPDDGSIFGGWAIETAKDGKHKSRVHAERGPKEEEPYDQMTQPGRVVGGLGLLSSAGSAGSGLPFLEVERPRHSRPALPANVESLQRLRNPPGIIAVISSASTGFSGLMTAQGGAGASAATKLQQLARKIRMWLADQNGIEMPDLIILIDRETGLGLWIYFRPELSGSAVTWRIEVTGDGSVVEMSVT